MSKNLGNKTVIPSKHRGNVISRAGGEVLCQYNSTPGYSAVAPFTQSPQLAGFSFQLSENAHIPFPVLIIMDRRAREISFQDMWLF